MFKCPLSSPGFRVSRRAPLALALISLFTPHIGLADEVSQKFPDEISYFGEIVSSTNQWPRSSAWGISYRKIVAPNFALSLAYLNDGHFPGHHRDGVTAEMWLPLNLFSDRLTLSLGGGPFYYYDTVAAGNSNGYADAHGWAWLASADAMWQPWLYSRQWWSHVFFELRFDHTAPAKSIETNSVGFGIGYRGGSDVHQLDSSSAENAFKANEIVAYYGKTVVNSFSSQTTRAEDVEYRRKIWEELRFSVGFLNEGNAQLIRRNGITAEVWAEPSFESGVFSIGAGFGGYSALDKYRPAPGRHVSYIMSATASVRPLAALDVGALQELALRVTWHRILTDYNRDTDVLLFALGYRF